MPETPDTTPLAVAAEVVKSVKPSKLRKLIIPIGIASFAGLAAFVTKVATSKDAPVAPDSDQDLPQE